MNTKLSDYFPGILLLCVFAVVGCCVYGDYGISYDEPVQRYFGLLSYDYVFHHSNELLQKGVDHHGTGFELVLVFVEKLLKITDSRELYLMRHLVSHLFFLAGCFAGYVLALGLFRNRFTACLCFLMLVMAPRIYAHSFFNSKDVPVVGALLIAMAFARAAFEKSKAILFLFTGACCGFATSIRITGAMMGGFIFLFLMADLLRAWVNGQRATKPLLCAILFIPGFGSVLYLCWPYLWSSPLHNFIESGRALTHYGFSGNILFEGKEIAAENLPRHYFFKWFLISNPELWLVAGAAGIGRIVTDFFRRPGAFIANTAERNFLLYLLCFACPLLALLLMHSVIYDDWRHLYFVYPFFVFMTLYFINKVLQTKLRAVMMALCTVQVVTIGWFMITDHPFQQVYFNNLVSHRAGELRKNYDLEYWGCSYKQALDFLIKKFPTGAIKVCSDNEAALDNNLLLLKDADRRRFVVDGAARVDYFITNYRGHPDDYNFAAQEYSINVLNSSIMTVYRIR